MNKDLNSILSIYNVEAPDMEELQTISIEINDSDDLCNFLDDTYDTICLLNEDLSDFNVSKVFKNINPMINERYLDIVSSLNLIKEKFEVLLDDVDNWIDCNGSEE